MGKKGFAIHPFEKLKKTIECNQAVLSSPPALSKKKEEHLTDEELFCDAMDDVQEIEEYRALSCAQSHRKIITEPARRHPDHAALMMLSEIAEGRQPLNLPDTQEYVEWTNPDYRDDIIQRLHGGHFSVQGFLDLHGFTVSEAERELESFIGASFKKGLRCIKIIHGRGLRSTRGARLKEAVVRRLSGHYRKDIIAYVTARQCDGGLGALYVLLRRK
jgi:DNA-nicking Smr family endonuclease